MRWVCMYVQYARRRTDSQPASHTNVDFLFPLYPSFSVSNMVTMFIAHENRWNLGLPLTAYKTPHIDLTQGSKWPSFSSRYFPRSSSGPRTKSQTQPVENQPFPRLSCYSERYAFTSTLYPICLSQAPDPTWALWMITTTDLTAPVKLATPSLPLQNSPGCSLTVLAATCLLRWSPFLAAHNDHLQRGGVTVTSTSVPFPQLLHDA